MKTVEFGIVFERAQGPQLQAAECLLIWFSHLFGESLVGCDLAWCARSRTLVGFLRFAEARFGREELQRLQFWSLRAGGRARPVAGLSPVDASRLQETVNMSQARAIGLTVEGMERAVVDLCTAAGLDARRREFADERPILTIDVGGPRWATVRWNDDEETLFIASPISPPVGDSVPVIARIPGWPLPAIEWTRVAEVRAPQDAAPGHPAGYSLSFETAPAELRAALRKHAPVASYGSRAAPRFPLAIPIRAVLEPATPPAPPDFVEEPFLGWVENLSLGGAFVRTAIPPPVGTALVIRFRLPTSVIFETRCAVAFSDVHGVGLRFILEAAGMAELHDAVALLSAHPRRALVIDDDSLPRQLVAAALVERGFEVLTAADAREGLHLLAEEALAIDLLVTDLILPGVDGEELVATIRRAGGESDLVVVVMTGRPDAGLARRLQAAGADLLLGKELGPELIAQKADGVLEGRRNPQPQASPSGPRPHAAAVHASL